MDIDEEAQGEGVGTEKVFSMQPKLITIKATGIPHTVMLPNIDESSDQ